MWKENVKHGVGHPNGQLEQVFFPNCSACGTSDEWESCLFRDIFTPYTYETSNGACPFAYNPTADDFNKVPGWSTVDITTPEQSSIKPWYVYATDIPGFEFDEGIIGFYICETCQDIVPGKIAIIPAPTLHQRY